MIAAALLLAQYAGTLDLSSTSRADVRSTQPFPTLENPSREIILATDASITPSARLRWNDRRWDYSLIYSPSLSVTDIELGSAAQPVVLNAGSASIGWHDRFVRITVSESASFGFENLAYVYATPGAIPTQGATGQAGQTGQTGQTGTGQTPPGQTGQTPTGPTSTQATGQVPGQPANTTGQLFPIASSSTGASLSWRTARTVTLSLSGAYFVTGNLTGNQQAAIGYPEQFGPSGSVSVGYAISKSDSLASTAIASNTTTPEGACVPPVVNKFCREVSPSFSAQETFLHRISKTGTVSASLGASAAIYQLTNEEAWGLLPVGIVSFSDTLRAPVTEGDSLGPSVVRLSAGLQPAINIITGLPSNRLQFTASLSNRVAPNVALGATVSALQSVSIPYPDPSPLTVFGGGVDLQIRMTRQINVGLGVQILWQSQENVGTLPVTAPMTATTATGSTTSASEVGYVSLSARLPSLRF